METEKTGNNVRANHQPKTATETGKNSGDGAAVSHQPALVTGGEWTGSPSPGSEQPTDPETRPTQLQRLQTRMKGDAGTGRKQVPPCLHQTE